MLIELLLALGIVGSGVGAGGYILNKTIEKRTERIQEVFDEDLMRETEAIRKQEKLKSRRSIKRSKSIMRGKAAEMIAPHLKEFPYDPADARPMGSPIDMVVFDGSTLDNIEKVVLVEVKTGNSRLNTRQKQVKKAVEEGRIEFLEFRVDTSAEPIEHEEKLAQIDECYCEDCVHK